MDALLRQVTSYCDKLWRFQRLKYYDAWELENAPPIPNSSPLFPAAAGLSRTATTTPIIRWPAWAILRKPWKEGDMMSEEEILKLQQNTQDTNMEGVSRPSKCWLRSKCRQHKK